MKEEPTSAPGSNAVGASESEPDADIETDAAPSTDAGGGTAETITETEIETAAAALEKHALGSSAALEHDAKVVFGPLQALAALAQRDERAHVL